MQTWVLYVIGASFLYALVNISDQYLVAKYSTGERGSGGLVLFSSLIGIVTALIIPLFTSGLFEVSLFDKVLLMFTGALSVAWIILYLYALEIEDVSKVVPWFLTVPVFGYIFGYLFLGETLTLNQQIGSVIMMLGLILLNVNFYKAANLEIDNENKDENTKQIKTNNFKPKSVFYMLFACIIIALQGIIFKYVTVESSFWISFFWEYVGLGLVGIFIFIFSAKYRREFMHMNKEGGKQIFFLNTTSEVTTIIGNLLTTFSLLLVPVTMVYLLGSFQPAFVLFLTLLGTFFFPKIVTENINKKVLIPKVIAIIIMTIGSVILFY